MIYAARRTRPRESRASRSLRPALLLLCLAALGACGDAEPTRVEGGPHADLVCTSCHGVSANADLVVPVSDATCIGCHASAELEPTVQVANVSLSHAAHPPLAGTPALGCAACHTHETGQSELTVATASCFLCHAQLPEPGAAAAVASIPVEQCGDCHLQPTHTAFATAGEPIDHATVLERGISCLVCHYDVVQGTGAAPASACRSCHGLAGGPAPLRSGDVVPVDSLHRVHGGPDVDLSCARCHEAVDHSIIQLASSLVLRCESCHAPGDPALNPPIDSTVHRATQLLYAGLDSHPGAATSVKFADRVACTSCHGEATIATERGSTARLRAINAECVACHGSRFGALLEPWMNGMHEHLMQAGAFIRAAAGDPRIRQRAAADSAARRALTHYLFLDSALLVHNIPAADAELRAAVSAAGEAYRLAGIAAPARPRLGPDVATQACVRCHYGIDLQQSAVFEQTFDHGDHVIDASLDCAQCHSTAELFQADGRTFDPAHGRTPIRAADCAQCHHVDRMTGCTSCHRAAEVDRVAHSATVTVHVERGNLERTRSVGFRHTAHAAVECGACHRAGTIAQPVGDCAGCHIDHHQTTTAAACTSCHGTAVITEHERTDHLACRNCHERTTLATLERADRRLCLSCHTEQATHQPDGECAQCHLLLTPVEMMQQILSGPASTGPRIPRSSPHQDRASGTWP